ncbi:ead/Ea22-like family protein [Escherichia coli]|uniref:ead/Ea22-like family protein n=1 Tax=Escherichia coli TaxID=562 RepID=UPI0010E10B10|nr:ead/Ea22-like family protein [Escherichia coli]HAY7404977.1 ead/Ea22-like family protein [Shigella flexneri]HEB1312073.1 ead/Ea22-like family protein [Escherichia albertii]MBL4187832.1 ead/Ea22-like family protein [Escherichia coli]MCE3943917.1 ead/Ea22-like family protein [Escherichia coli]MCE3948761.1 ead/Ea22-like family protein [Escherichia coli]
MTNSTAINYQALREIAKLATQGEWVAFISPGTDTYAVHTPGDERCGDIVKWPGFDDQKNAENNAEFIAAFNPEVVQALLDEREAQSKRIAELEASCAALAAENAGLKAGAMYFSYGSEFSFECHKTAEEAIAAAEAAIDDYRGDACDGWSEEVESICWGVIIQQATKVGERKKRKCDRVSPWIERVCDYELRPNVETPATDAFLAEVKTEARKEGAYFVANTMLAAWEAGFIDDTAKNAADIARMILTSTEFMANAPEGDFDRSFSDGVLEDIAAQLRKGGNQ